MTPEQQLAAIAAIVQPVAFVNETVEETVRRLVSIARSMP